MGEIDVDPFFVPAVDAAGTAVAHPEIRRRGAGGRELKVGERDPRAARGLAVGRATRHVGCVGELDDAPLLERRPPRDLLLLRIDDERVRARRPDETDPGARQREGGGGARFVGRIEAAVEEDGGRGERHRARARVDPCVARVARPRRRVPVEPGPTKLRRRMVHDDPLERDREAGRVPPPMRVRRLEVAVEREDEAADHAADEDAVAVELLERDLFAPAVAQIPRGRRRVGDVRGAGGLLGRRSRRRRSTCVVVVLVGARGGRRGGWRSR